MARFLLSCFADEIDSDLSVQIREIKKHGISQIEMRGVNGRNVIDHSPKEMMEIKKQLDNEGISVSAIGSPIGKIKISDPFATHLDKFKHTLELAGILGTRYIRMFSFYIPQGESAEKYRDEVLERWHAFASAAGGMDIVLAHENEKEIYGDTPERCLDIMREINLPSVRLVFDPANFIQCGVETWPHAYEMLKPYIEYMHIKDALAGSGKVVPAGAGDGKLEKIIGGLDGERSGDFILSLEPHLGSFAGLAGLETDIDLSKMEESGPGKFEIAVTALKKVLGKLGK